MQANRLGCSVAALISLTGTALAQHRADSGVTTTPAAVWSGLYVGGHLSMATGSAPKGTIISHSQSKEDVFLTSNAGVQLGYNHVLSGRYLLGVEADASFANFFEGDDTLATRSRHPGFASEKIDHIATIRARFGFIADQTLIYATGGLAWGQARFNDSLSAPGEGVASRHQRFGWAMGAGIEHGLGSGWSSRLEYLYTHLGEDTVRLKSGPIATTELDLHAVRASLNYNLSTDPSAQAPGSNLSSSFAQGTHWNVHGQSTLVIQGYPSFRSQYEGANSLTASSQIRNTGSASAFLGLRLSPQTEFYINPEIYQGFGLSDVHGLAGFSNGEAQKSSFPIPRSNIARLFVRHTIGLGGEQEKLEDGPNQLAGSQDISRVTITAGKLAVKDFFDVNTYANDPRVGFLNWNMYGGGSYDWTMDKLSWT